MLLFCLQLDILANFLLKNQTGQGNYAAANSSLDAFAPFWSSKGRSGLRVQSFHRFLSDVNLNFVTYLFQVNKLKKLLFVKKGAASFTFFGYFRIRTNRLSAVGSLGAFLGHICWTNLDGIFSGASFVCIQLTQLLPFSIHEIQ